MSLPNGLIDFIYLITSFVGLVISGILIFYRRPGPNSFNFLLGISLGLLSIGTAIGFLGTTELFNLSPHLYRTGNIFVLSFMSFSYFYIRGIVRHIPPQTSDLLFFLPTLFYIIDFLPFFLLSGQDKVSLIESGIAEHMELAFSEGWITPPWFHLYFRHLVVFGFWVLQLRLLITKEVQSNFRKQNKHWYNWIWLYQIHQSFYLLPLAIHILIGMNTDIRLYYEKLPLASLLLLYLYLYSKPSILYGIQHITRNNEIANGNNAGSNKTIESPFTKDQVESIMKVVEGFMQKKRPYLIKGYSLNELSYDVKIPHRSLSTVLNQNYGANFNEFINKYRIEHFLARVSRGDHQNKTLEGLAKECGFNNRITFIKSFKKVKGITPSQYIMNLKNSSSVNNSE